MKEHGLSNIEYLCSEDSGDFETSKINFLNKTFAFTGIGLLISFLIASTFGVPVLMFSFSVFGQSARFIPLIVTLILSIFIRSTTKKASPTLSIVLYLVFVSIYGIGLSPIFLMYGKFSLIISFLISSIVFFAMAIFGFVTKKDLSPMIRILMMGLIGLLACSIGRMFFPRFFGPLEFLTSIVGVLIFAGLTAYDMQKIKRIHSSIHKTEVNKTSYAIVCALELFLDFMGLFLYIVRILGRKR